VELSIDCSLTQKLEFSQEFLLCWLFYELDGLFTEKILMEDSNIVACPFDPSEEKVPLRVFGWTLFESFRRHSTSVALVSAVLIISSYRSLLHSTFSIQCLG